MRPTRSFGVLHYFFAVLLLMTCASASGQQYLDLKSTLLEQINAERRKHHAKPLVYDDQYQPRLDVWAKHIVKTMEHNRSDRYRGETIGGFLGTDELIVPLFMKSPAHKEILMDKQATTLCLSVYFMPAEEIVKKNSVESIPQTYYTVIRTFK